MNDPMRHFEDVARVGMGSLTWDDFDVPPRGSTRFFQGRLALLASVVAGVSLIGLLGF